MQAPATTTYDVFVELRAARTGTTESAVRAAISPAQFEEHIRDLHTRYLNREFTIGKMADLLGVPSLNLVDLLDEMGLPIRYF